MRISAATIVWMVALFLVSSACGGGISLGSNDAPSAADGGHPAGSVGQTTGQTTGPSADASAERPVVDAGLRPSRPDSGPSTDDASTPIDIANLGQFAELSDCGYTRVDPHNCGSCGHDCAGGACQDGVCVPLPPGVLASGLIAPTSVAVDANNVYWLSEGVHPAKYADASFEGLVQVMKCAKTGCNNSPTILASGVWDFLTGKDTLHGLTVDSANVYWATEQGLFACAIDGCNNSPTMLLSNPPVLPPTTISVSGDIVYDVSFTGVVGCATSGCNGDGGGAGASNVLWQGQAQGVLADSTTAYWSSNGNILSCALGGCNGAPTLLQQSQVVGAIETIGQIAEDDNYLYYTDLGTATSAGNIIGRIGKCSVTACAPDCSTYSDCPKIGATIASPLESPRGIAVDETNVYWSDFGSAILDSNAQWLLSVDGRIVTSPK